VGKMVGGRRLFGERQRNVKKASDFGGKIGEKKEKKRRILIEHHPNTSQKPNRKKA